jgi:hypothetical protein
MTEWCNWISYFWSNIPVLSPLTFFVIFFSPMWCEDLRYLIVDHLFFFMLFSCTKYVLTSLGALTDEECICCFKAEEENWVYQKAILWSSIKNIQGGTSYLFVGNCSYNLRSTTMVWVSDLLACTAIWFLVYAVFKFLE